MEFYRRIPDENIIIDRILKLVIDILVVIVIAVFVSVYLCKEEKVTGNSMASVLNSNEKVFVDTISYNIFEPDRYDVVMFNIKSKDNMEETYIKRIIGLPGETVQIKDGKIYINDKELNYNSKKDRIVNAGIAADAVKLGKDEYFVMGDNWNSSEDSRFTSIGNVKLKNITGKVWVRVSPFARAGFVGKPK
ncbi:MAG: signal peptidase I [Lachnospiraceae bacterium]|nr:signal peptidase I [Lachnospiraceae bacterium]